MAITPPRYNPDVSGFTETPEIPSPRAPPLRPASNASMEQDADYSLFDNNIGMPNGDASSLHRIRVVDPFATPSTGFSVKSPLAHRFGPSLEDSRLDDTFGPESPSDILGDGNTTILAPRRSNRRPPRDSILGTPVAYTGGRSRVHFELPENSPENTPAGYNSFLDHSHEDTLALIRPVETQFGPRPARIFDPNRSAERLIPYRDPDAPPAPPVSAPAPTRQPASRLQILRDSEAPAAVPSITVTPTRTLRPRATDGRVFGTALPIPAAAETPEEPRSLSKWEQKKKQQLTKTGDAIWEEYPSQINMTPDVIFKWHNWPPKKESTPILQNMNRFRLPFPKEPPKTPKQARELNRMLEVEEDWEAYRPWDNLSEEELLAVPMPVILLPSRVTDAILVAFQSQLAREKIAKAGETKNIPFSGPPLPEDLSSLPGPAVESDLRKPFTENVPRVRIPEHIQYPVVPPVIPERMTKEMPSCSNDPQPKENWNHPVSHVRGTRDDVLTLHDEPHRPISRPELGLPGAPLSSTGFSDEAPPTRPPIVYNPADIHSDPVMSMVSHEYQNLPNYSANVLPNYQANVLIQNEPWVMNYMAGFLNSLPDQRLEDDPNMAAVPSPAVLAFVQNYEDPGPQPKVAAPWEERARVQSSWTEPGASFPSPSKPPAWHALTDEVDKSKPFVPKEDLTEEEARALDEDIARNEQELEKNFRMQREMVAYGSDFRRHYEPIKSAAHIAEREKFNLAQQRWNDRHEPPMPKLTIINKGWVADVRADRQGRLKEGTKKDQDRAKRMEEEKKKQGDMLKLALTDAEWMEARRIWMVSIAQEKTKAIQEGRTWKLQNWQRAIPRSEVVAAVKNAQKAPKTPARRSTAKNAAEQSVLKATPKTPAPKISTAKKAAPKSGQTTTNTPSAKKRSLIITLKAPPAGLDQITTSVQDTGALLAPGMIDINAVSTSQVTPAPSGNKRKRATGAEDTPDTARPPPKKRTTTKSRNGENPDPIIPAPTAASGAATPTITREVTAAAPTLATSVKKVKALRGKHARAAAQAALVAEETTNEHTVITAPSVENPTPAAPTPLSTDSIAPTPTPVKKSRPSKSKEVIATENPVRPSVNTTPFAQNNVLSTSSTNINTDIYTTENSVLHTETSIPSEQVTQPVLSVKNARTPRAKKPTAKGIENTPVQPAAPTITAPAPAAVVAPPTPAPAKAHPKKRAPRGKAAIAAAAAAEAAPTADAASTKSSLIIKLKVKLPPSLTLTNTQTPIPSVTVSVAEPAIPAVIAPEVSIPEIIPDAVPGNGRRKAEPRKKAEPTRQGQPRGRAALAAAAAAEAAALAVLNAADTNIPAPTETVETSIPAPTAPDTTASEAISEAALNVAPNVITPAPVPAGANKRKRTTNENAGVSGKPAAKKRLTKKEVAAAAAAAAEEEAAALAAQNAANTNIPAAETSIPAPDTTASDTTTSQAASEAASIVAPNVIAPVAVPVATNKRKRTTNQDTGVTKKPAAKKRLTKKQAAAIAAAAEEEEAATLAAQNIANADIPAPTITAEGATPAPDTTAPDTTTPDNAASEATSSAALNTTTNVITPAPVPSATNKRKRTTGASQNPPAKKRLTKKEAAAIAAAEQVAQQEAQHETEQEAQQVAPPLAPSAATVEPSTDHAQSLIQGAILFAQKLGVRDTEPHQEIAQQQVVEQVVEQVVQQYLAAAGIPVESATGAAAQDAGEQEQKQQPPAETKKKAALKKAAPRKAKKAATRKPAAKKAAQQVLPQVEYQKVQEQLDAQIQQELASQTATTTATIAQTPTETKAPAQRRKRAAPAPVPTTRVTRSRAKKD
ncbi:Protein of unknown function [Pyronema omphalodes CBS 100304]|uniref:Uncharacterized protein n=1 Tax=Pyronema omphalodes (strain CBS 100304) TaxID=1076935 RepID=U4LIE8_PYROM|nr:Protein of unknown function [Pyronema omphalodes CBS 100304]